MADTDPTRLADQREHEADKLQRRSDELAGEVQDVSQDWERKRADPSVPGAPPHERPEADEGDEASESPAPEAPPEGAGPFSAETASEGAVGPPADSGSDSDDSDG